MLFMHLCSRLQAPLLIAACLVLSGCAIHQNKKGGYVFNMDLPEVFGTVMDKKPMPDGQSEVSLRKMGNQWSLKFGLFSRVVQLPKVTGGKILQVSRVGNDTNILLQTRTAKCPENFVLVSLNGTSQASMWQLEVPCGYPAPVVQTGSFEQFFDFIVGQRVARYIYRAGKLTRNRDVVLTPGMTLPQPIGAEASHSQVQRHPYVPVLPFSPTAEQLQQRPAPLQAPPLSAAPASSPPTRTTRTPSSPQGAAGTTAPPELKWSGTEVQPKITIDLRTPQ